MTTLRIRTAVAAIGERLPQPYVCEDLDAMLRVDADMYVGCGSPPPATQVLGPRFSTRRLERCRAKGVTSIVAGELGPRPPTYHPAQIVVAHVGSIGIVVVPAAGVEVTLRGELAVAAAELHAGLPVIAADLTLTAAPVRVPVRAASAFAEAPDAARRLPRHDVRAARVAR